MSTSTNVKTRSAAEKALVNILTGTANANYILVVLDCAKYVLFRCRAVVWHSNCRRASEPTKSSVVDPNSLFGGPAQPVEQSKC